MPTPSSVDDRPRGFFGFRESGRPLLVALAVLAFAAPLAAGAAEGPVAVAGSRDVLRYGYFEAALANARRYADPFRDVTLAAEFTHAGGRSRRVQGFYDGGDLWRVRFRADAAGLWRYTAVFSDGSPGQSGSFRVQTAAERFGPVGVDPANPIWFRRGEEPFYLRAFHAGDRFFAENWSDEKRAAFLDWFQQQGYNTISVASHYLNRDEPGRGRGWQTPRLWPLDPGEYRKMERILDELDRRGIVVFPFAGFIGKKSNCPRTAADQELYVRYTIARIGHMRNLLYNVAGPEPNVGDHWLAADVVARLGGLIRGADVYGHPLTVHNRTGDDDYRDSDWSTFGTLQGPKTLDRGKLAAGLLKNHHPAKPLFAQETLWSGNRFHVARNQRDYSDDDLRKHAFVIAMCGAGFCFADNDGDSSSGFSGTLDLAGRAARRHDVVKAAWDCIESLPYHEMKPQPSLASRGYCLAQPGRRYLVYQESRGAFSVKTEGGPFRATWINGQQPADRRDGGAVAGNDFQTPADGDDWLLVLESI